MVLRSFIPQQMSQILRLSSSNICKSQLNTIFTDAASETIAQLYGCRNCRILRSKRHEVERQGEHMVAIADQI
jgi:hypothetical protein